MKTETFQRASFLLLLAAVSVAFLWMIRGFLLMLFLAAVFAGFAAPLNLWFRKKLGGRKAPASILTLLTLVFIVGVPLFSFAGLLTKEAIKVSTVVTPWLREKLDEPREINQLMARLPGYSIVSPYRREISSRIGNAVSNLGQIIFSKLSQITSGTVTVVLQLVLMLYVMFFLFIHGESWLAKFFHLLPLRHEHEMKILKSFRSMIRATIRGTVAVGVAQGTLGGVALGLAGIPSPLFWGTVMAVASLIPTVGPAIVWAPAGIILLIQGQVGWGVFVLVWCALVVGSVDNILRPILVGKDAGMNELMVLMSTLGGIFVFGLPGFIIGPVLAGLFVTTWDIYSEIFKEYLPPTAPAKDKP